jgi:acid phosphatase type 7
MREYGAAWKRSTGRVAAAIMGAIAMITVPANPMPTLGFGATPVAAATGDPVLAAAGDIACDPTDGAYNGGSGTSTACAQKATSDLLVNMAPNAVAALGDNQYNNGSLSAFNTAYNPSWGRVKPAIHPAIGNHEIKSDTKATGYYTYFGAAAGTAGKGWYSYDLGTWHIIVLDGNCKNVGGCGSGSAQEQWLKSDLAAHPAACTLAYWHQPRFSSGNHGGSTMFTPFWNDLYNAGAEVVLNGHDHDYERFAPQTPSGARNDSTGIREFVVGTGGAHWEPMGTVQPNSLVRSQAAFGVLKLTLHAGSYDWSFVPVAGKTFTDSGTGYCH